MEFMTFPLVVSGFSAVEASPRVASSIKRICSSSPRVASSIEMVTILRKSGCGVDHDEVLASPWYWIKYVSKSCIAAHGLTFSLGVSCTWTDWWSDDDFLPYADQLCSSWPWSCWSKSTENVTLSLDTSVSVSSDSPQSFCVAELEELGE